MAVPVDCQGRDDSNASLMCCGRKPSIIQSITAQIFQALIYLCGRLSTAIAEGGIHMKLGILNSQLTEGRTKNAPRLCIRS